MGGGGGSSGVAGRDDDSHDALLDIDPIDTPEARLEFQNFVLGTAEQNIKLSGSTRPKASSTSWSGRGGYTRVDSNAALPASGAVLPEPVTRPSGSTNAFWTIEFYQQFFDVNTLDVADRMLESVLPRGVFMEKIGNNPDLYGPFWISTTVIFALFVTSTIAGSIYAYIHAIPFTYDMTLLTVAVSSVYLYVTVLPGILWTAGRYFGTPMKFFDLIDLYGYGMTIWIPVSLLCILPSELIRWVLIAAAFAISTFFKIQNILPLMSGTTHPTAKTTVVSIIAVAHLGLALLFRFEFFSFVANISGGEKGGSR
ncbi:hypothetical protein DFJ73DRAFT_529672 [Zopfochytrium polystomum]|nr:hypothetical protein DFJ73DRAFT_529672 [Zopfochytrium polystomum]